MKRILLLGLLFAALSAAQSVSNRAALVSFGTMSAAAASNSVNVSTLAPSKHTLQAIVTGSPTGCQIQLEGSLDNVNWFNLSGSQVCTANLQISVTERPESYIRVNLTTLSGGTSPTVTVTYTGVF